uniref:Vascular endothelial growth factor C n=1 Tax=Xiphophorus couchianus TaxID=32473 RepID=A0A3B5M1N8_9TELE
MHLLGISLFLAYLLYTNLASDFSHRDYDDEYAEQEPMDEPVSLPDMEQKLRSASSVDELMSLIYPSYWAALKCRSKLSAAASSASKFTQRPQTHRLRPLSEAEEPTYAAAYLNLDVLKSIELEWRKTQCMPREVCVDVGREFGAPTNVFYKPPCVSVYRCGGCCPSEDKQCRNISTGYLSKTLFEITVPLTQGTKPVTISVANHTQCSCLSKLDIYRQVHSIIRRALPECAIANRTCPPGQVWNTKQCQCINILSSDLCGPDKELDVESCQCVCRLENPTRDCGPKRHLDRNTCQCVCNMLPAPSCPQNHIFNKETCQCTCNKTCPRHQPLNKTKCSCECNESPNKCFLRGRRFHQATSLRPSTSVRNIRYQCANDFP